MLVEKAPWIMLGKAALTFPIMLHNRNFSWLSLLCSSNQKEKEKEILFLWLTEIQRMSGLVSLASLRIAQMAPLKWMCLILEKKKGKRKLEMLKQGDFPCICWGVKILWQHFSLFLCSSLSLVSLFLFSPPHLPQISTFVNFNEVPRLKYGDCSAFYSSGILSSL